jgi:hypothetical protein
MSDSVELISLLWLQEPVVHRQIHIHDQHVGHSSWSAVLREGLGDRLTVGGPPGVEQQPQGVVDPAFSLLGRPQENPQVFLDRAAGPPVGEHVVGHPEPTGREHCVAVAVLLERPGLAYQPVDDVAVLDAMLPSAPETRQGVDPVRPVPDFQGLGHDMNINPLSNETAGQRVGVAADMDRAPRVDSRLDSSGHLQPARRQRRQHGHFFEKTLLSVSIAPRHELAEKALILVSVGKIAAPAQQEGLVDGLLETVMTLLDVAVLVGFSWLDRLGFEAIVGHQGLVSPGERPGVRIGVDRRGQSIGAVPPGNSSQFPQGVLQPFAETLEALGEADRTGFPVGIRQHEVIDQVVERRAGEGDAERAHVGEIALGEPPRLVGLCEEHLPGRPFQGAPLFDPALEATELDVGEPSRKAPLQVIEEGLGLEPRVEPELLEKFVPDVLERVLPGPPGAWDTPLTGERVGVAVLACRFLIDAGLVGSLSQGVFGLDQLPQPPEQTIGDHPDAPA